MSDLDGKRFVTARGWEDLSQVMKVYEQLGFAIDYDFVVQYLQDGRLPAILLLIMNCTISIRIFTVYRKF